MSSGKSAAKAIVVKNLNKFYGSFQAVDNVSFEVARGEIVGFLGPNGAGKSTIMRVLTCYMSATGGDVQVAGHDVYRQPLAVRRAVGYQPEDVPLYEDMVVYDYLAFMAKMRGVRKADRELRLQYVTVVCGLRDVMGKLVRELSKGFRQRVGLAQALIHDPEVLILDEPMSGLDPNQIIEIRDLIKKIGREKTVIFSSHILQEIEKLCDRLLIIDRGRIVADGTAAELTALLEGRRRYLVSVAAAGADETAVKRQLESLAKRVQVLPPAVTESGELRFQLTSDEGEDLREAVSDAVHAAGWGLLELREVVLTLEDVFRTLTGRDRDGDRTRPALNGRDPGQKEKPQSPPKPRTESARSRDDATA